MPAATDQKYVVVAGSLGGHYKTGEILEKDAFPEERMKHFIARGAIKVATQEDIDKANAVPVGLVALGSTDEAPNTPLAAFEEEKTRRDAEIQALETRIAELEDARDRELPQMQKDAELQEAAMSDLKMIPLGSEPTHSGSSSTATNAPGSGATAGGGEPSEPVDPAKQAAAEKASVSVRGRNS